jgi:nitroreductase
MINEIRTRRSVRKYTDQPVSDEILTQILESARLAPSGNNMQPWHFIVIRSKETRQRLAEVSHKQAWMAAAPVFIVCIADIRARLRVNGSFSVDEKSPQFELKQAIRDTSIAVEHMVLEAESLGLSTCWIAWFDQKDVRPVLNIPTDKYVLNILTIGYPDEKPNARPRKPLETIVHYEKW